MLLFGDVCCWLHLLLAPVSDAVFCMFSFMCCSFVRVVVVDIVVVVCC